VHPIRTHEVLCIVARRSGKNVSDAQTSRPPPDSIFPNFMTDRTDTIFGGRTDRCQHRGDRVGGGRWMGEGPRRDRASAERIYRPAVNRKDALPTCCEPRKDAGHAKLVIGSMFHTGQTGSGSVYRTA